MGSFVILIILILFLAFLFLFFAVQFYNLTFRGFAPFISSRPYVIKAILKELNLNDRARVYELGSGRAGFLRAIEENFPTAELVGIEYSLLPYCLSRMQTAISKSKIEIKREDIFKTDIRNADLIYCYLNINTMKRLKAKFEQECRPGTRIISYMFSIPGWEPEKKIDIPEQKDERIYIYTV